jgi:hypothetical protein
MYLINAQHQHEIISPKRVDSPALGETADEDDGAVREGLGGRVPTVNLHGEDGSVVEPLAVLTERRCIASARVEDADGLCAVVVLVRLVEAGGVPAGVRLRADVTAGR